MAEELSAGGAEPVRPKNRSRRGPAASECQVADTCSTFRHSSSSIQAMSKRRLGFLMFRATGLMYNDRQQGKLSYVTDLLWRECNRVWISVTPEVRRGYGLRARQGVIKDPPTLLVYFQQNIVTFAVTCVIARWSTCYRSLQYQTAVALDHD